MTHSATPWWNRIPSILAFPFDLSGAIALAFMFGASVFQRIGSLGMFGMLGTIIATGAIFSVVFLVIRHSARGATSFPSPGEIEDGIHDVIVPGLKVLALTIALYVPVIYCGLRAVYSVGAGGLEAYSAAQEAAQDPFGPPKVRGESGFPFDSEPAGSFSTEEGEDEEAENGFAFDPETEARLREAALAAAFWFAAAVACAVFCSLIYPLCLVVLAMSGSLRTALFPVTWFVILKAVPLGYLGLLAALGAGSGICFALTFPLSRLPVPILPALLSDLIEMYFALCGAHLLGWFVFQNRARLGIADEVPHVATPLQTGPAGAPVETMRYAPAGSVRVGIPAGPPVPGGPPAPGEILPGAPAPAPWESAAPGGEVRARFDAAIAARDAAAAVDSAPHVIDACWNAGDAPGAWSAYDALRKIAPEASLGPERMARLAKELETVARDLEAAMVAWRTLAFVHPDHPRAPNALWRCAEICEKLARPDWARSACDAILARYPMSEVAPMAQQKLKRLGAAAG